MSLCCDCCFNDQILKDFIKQKGKKSYCDFCETEREYCIMPSELKVLFRPVVNLYAPVEEIGYDGIEYREDYYEDSLWEMLQEDWKVFCSNNSEVNEKLIRNIFSSSEGSHYPSEYLDSNVYNWIDFQTENSSDKIRYRKWWKLLSKEIKHENRFFPKIPEWLLSNPNEVFSISLKTLKKDSIFFRARINNNSHKFPCDEMGKPPIKKAIDNRGRGNPKGIPYLYLASNENTAISEVKPSKNIIITVGKFIVNNELSVIDLRNPQIDSPFKYGEELEYCIKNLSLLKSLGSELSRPVNDELDYLPTQYLCELIKGVGHDGLIYKSFLGNGYNILIYNDYKLECFETWNVEVTDIKYEYQKVVPFPSVII